MQNSRRVSSKKSKLFIAAPAKYLLVITAATALLAANSTMHRTNTKSKRKISVSQCKKMLGKITYERLNILYNDPNAALLQCQFRLERGKYKK